MSGMLEQAIADATALKEAALKKAEAAVLEAAKPKIEESLRSLLEQEDEEGLDDLLGGGGPMEPDMGPGEVSGLADNVPMGVTDGENMCPCPDEEEEIEIDFGELERQMAADEQADSMGQEDLAQGLDLSAPDDTLGVGMDAGEEEEDVELEEEILSALFENGDAVEALSEEEHCDDDNMTSRERMHRGDIEELDENEDVTEEAKMTRDMMALASKDAHQDYMKTKGDRPEKKPAPRHKSMGQEFDLDTGDDTSLELAREGKIVVSQEKLMEIVRSATKDLFTSKAKEMDKVLEENKKLKSFVRRLTDELKDTNLQNARLLYTNQILESVSLNERQKRKIAEAVTKAGSVEEVKVIYETLLHSVGTSGGKKKPKSLNEAVEKRSTPLFPRRHKPEKQANPVKDRMQKLAGIK